MRVQPGPGEDTAGDAPAGGRAPGTAGGVGAVLLGAAAWGSTGTAAHFAPVAAAAASVGAARIVLGGVVLLGLALRRRHRAGLAAMLAAGRAARTRLVLAAVAVAAYQLCFFSAVRLTGVAIGAVVAIGSAPVFTGLISRAAGGPALTRRWMIATAAAIAGCSVLVTGGKAAGVQLGGVGLALLAGAGYAYLGLVTTVAAYLLYGYGLRVAAVPTAVTLGLAEPAVAALLGVAVLGERLTAPALAGLVLVGLAIAILASAGRRINTTGPG